MTNRLSSGWSRSILLRHLHSQRRAQSSCLGSNKRYPSPERWIPLESLLLGTIDSALAAQNAVVALESLGLGSVYIGAIRNDIEGVAKELGLPPQVYPVFGLCVGYPSAERPAQVAENTRCKRNTISRSW
ncbi:nitroreductase family protein [Pseudomonas cerasi]